MTFPQRPASHITGDKAVNLVKSACDPSWVIAEVVPDYGLDLRIELTDGNNVMGQEILVQVKGASDVNHEQPTVKIRQATINYWLTKLAPVLVVLVETNSETIWYGWLESIYPAYPKMIASKKMVTLKLSQTTSKKPLSEEIPRYAARYYGQLGLSIKNPSQRARLLEMLFHLTNITHQFYELFLYLQGHFLNSQPEEKVREEFRRFYENFGIHNQFLADRWKHFVELGVPIQILNAFEDRFLAYESIISTFFIPETPTQELPDSHEFWGKRFDSSETIFLRFHYEELFRAIAPALQILRDIEVLVFRILLLGRLQFVDE